MDVTFSISSSKVLYIGLLPHVGPFKMFFVQPQTGGFPTVQRLSELGRENILFDLY